MNLKNANPQARLYAGSILILAVGLCCALVIYLTAGDAAEDAARYVVVDGVTYSVSLADSKSYVHDLRLYGGKAAVLFDELLRWFGALWRGKALGVTLGWISVLVSAGVFLYAKYLTPGGEPGE